MKQEVLNRGQFTFYASCFIAVEKLPKSRRYEVLQGIIRFALYGEEPELKGAALGVFESIRPHLTAGRDKAAWRLRRNAAAAAEPADSLSAVHSTVRM